jgi:hypothetical protein
MMAEQLRGAPLLRSYTSLCIIAAHCCQSKYFSNGPRINFMLAVHRSSLGELLFLFGIGGIYSRIYWVNFTVTKNLYLW